MPDPLPRAERQLRRRINLLLAAVAFATALYVLRAL